MDAQTTGTRSATLAALVASIAHLELEAGYHPEELLDAPELLAELAENRFLAARHGMQARLLDPIVARPLPAYRISAVLRRRSAVGPARCSPPWGADLKSKRPARS
jgi:gamma-glutamyl:cysteine ligase YbdK (ATP-grasp superfamily)